MSQGNDFANYASSADDSAVEGEGTASEDMWFVAIASDDIKQMTIDQLDQAFRLGVITAQTAVWTEGMETWAPLGEVADLDSDADEGQHSNSGAGHEHAHARGASALESAVHHSLHHHNPHQSDVFQTGSRSRAMEQPSFAPGPNSFAPVTASLSPASIFAAPAPAAPLMQSSVPVALNVDEDMPSVARGRRWHPERWLLAVAAIAGVGVTAYNNSDLFSASAATSTEASKALAARPYETGVERGGTPAAPSHASDGDDPAVAPSSAKPASDEAAPIGSASAKAAEAPAAEAAVAGGVTAATKESLKGSFSKAFASGGAKKAPTGKAAKAVKPRKASHATSSRASKTATRATKASKKPGVPRAASAFDPLNGSLP